jgi:hypothetical protein
MKKLSLCLFLFLTSSPLLAQNQPQGPLSVLPGDTISVTTASELIPPVIVTVTLTPTGKSQDIGTSTLPACNDIAVSPVETAGARSFSFSIPLDACSGAYALSASAKKTGDTTPGSKVDITSPNNIQVRPPVAGLDPNVLFKGGNKTLTFLGPPALKNVIGYTLQFTGHALPVCAHTDDAAKADVSCYSYLQDKSQDGQIVFLLGGRNFLAEFQGEQTVSLVHNGASSVGQAVHIVDATRNTPRNYAFGVTAALVVLIYLLLSSGSRTMQTATGRRSSLLTKLFMDEETKSYSLSKCQFYAWTFAAILGYIFLAVSKSIVQGSAVFPDIPDGLPGIILYSAGTSVLATWITSTRGSKGAGEDTPNFADFITSGGVVAPERLQFVVWTITGIFTFLTIVLRSDPLTVSDLPRIPDGFMNLMGISSVGYLAGKLARKPGPVISTLAVAKVTEQADENKLGDYKPPDASPAKGHVGGDVLTLGLQGEGLSPNASIKVDGNPLRADQFWINGVADPQTGFCTSLNVSLNNAAPYLEGSHTLTIVNPDAQAADAGFPVSPMTVTSASSVAPGDKPVEVKVSGEYFVADTSAEWKRETATTPAPIDNLAAGAIRAPDAEAVVFNSKNSISVWLIPGTTEGSGDLTLISPARLRARTTVAVKKPKP